MRYVRPGFVQVLLTSGVGALVAVADAGVIVSVRVPDDARVSEFSRRAQGLLWGPSGPATADVVSR